MKKIGLSILILLLSYCISKTNDNQKVNQNDLTGNWTWEKNDSKHDFTLRISKEGNFLVGRHCYIIGNGDVMDCSVSKPEISFKVNDVGLSKYEVEIISFYRGAKGIVSIQLIGKKMIWKIVKKPNDVFYLPLEATLIKEN
jgi:hypothetical protein